MTLIRLCCSLLQESFKVPPAWYGIPLKGMRINDQGKWERAYDPFVEPEAEPEPIDDADIANKEQETHGLKFPDMQGALNKLPFGFARKEFAGKK